MTSSDLSEIVTNARIKTGDPARPWATAIGIRDGNLAVVGGTAEILKMASAGCRMIDAGGQLITLPAALGAGSAVTMTVVEGLVTLHTSPEES